MIKRFLAKENFTLEQFRSELFKRELDNELIEKIYLALKLNLNTLDDNGKTLLHETIENKRFKSAIWLIKHGADIKIKNRYAQNSFDIAIEVNNPEFVKYLLALEEIDIETKDQDGRTYLQNAVVLGYHDIAKVLIEAGANINSEDKNGRNVIFDALSYGNEKFIDYLLDFKELELNKIDVNKNSIMHHHEVIKNDILAKKLIQRGANTTIKDKDGKTYLCKTALRGIDAYDLIDTALKNGADINSRVANNNTILMELISVSSKLNETEKDRRKSLFEMSKKVVLNGIDIDAIDINGETALFRAVRLNDFELTKFLLESKVDPNVQNNNLQSVLHIAVYHGIESIDILLLLLRFNANPLVKNKSDQTIYEILNEIILHTHGKKNMHDQFILSRIKQDGQYIRILKELLEHNKQDLNFLDSYGNPLFFTPLLNDHFPLFKLYIKYGLNIHNRNILNHNILFEYILRVFENNKELSSFQNNISMLLSNKLEHNIQDETGYTIVHKILSTPCNIHLFDILTDVILFDYTLTDNLGRSVIHTAVWHEQNMIMKRIHNINKKIVNIPDEYGILPLTYAALLGNQTLVLLLLELGSNVKSGVNISKAAIEKFKPMLKNLEKLKKNVEDTNTLRKMDILIDQVKRDFHVI